MKLDIKIFSGGDTQAAFAKATNINNSYAGMIQGIQNNWNQMDEWASQYTSGEVMKKATKNLADFLNGIPEPDGCNANAALLQKTDKIIGDANYEDQVTNEGQAQVSNPFNEQHMSCTENVPKERAYTDSRGEEMPNFKGITDEGVASIDTFRKYMGEIENKANEIFEQMGQGSIGTHVTGKDIEGSFKTVLDKDKETLANNVLEVKGVIDQYVKEAEERAKQVETY